MKSQELEQRLIRFAVNIFKLCDEFHLRVEKMSRKRRRAGTWPGR
jgi:hypothetical protein